MSTKVAGISQLFSNVTTDTTGVEQTSNADSVVKFSDFLSQNTNQTAQNYASQTGLADNNSSVTQEYSQYQYKDNSIQETKTVSIADKVSQVQDKLDSYSEKVKDVLKEELGVTDEEIEQAMETLGIQYADLTNQNNLAQLVSQLTGENVTDLLCNDSFMNIMQSVTAISGDLLQELGMTQEELTDFCSQFINEANDATQLVETSSDDEQALVENSTEIFEDQNVIEEQSNALPDMQEEKDWKTQHDTVETEPQKATTVSEEKATILGSKEVTEETVEETEETESTSTESSVVTVAEEDGKSGNDASQNQTNHQDLTQTGSNAILQQTVQLDAVNVNQTEFSQTYSQLVDIQNVIDQIVDSAKVTISAETTTMEMQLNPENLGKIYLEVSSKEGTVSARLVTQNEAVKEALQAQMVELKQNLTQAGVKVDAVEVTVSSHEFERNLDQNGKQQEQLAEQQEEQEQSGRQSRRNINLNNMEELSGVMSEEENLVAQIMQDNGNSMDIQA